MDDLISRQAAIEALAKFVPYAIDDDCTKAYTDGLTDAYNLICQLPAVEQEHRWISVTERLPEPNKLDARGFAIPYLVMNGWKMVTARRTDDYWVLFGARVVLEYVTHWMNLPEPPKEET